MTKDAAGALPRVTAVLLSMGNRPVELAKALETLHTQTGVDLDCVLLGNGWHPSGVPAWVTTEESPDNLGCPQGRNVGAESATGEFIFFYDDDAWLPRPDVLSRMVACMDDDVAVVQPKGVDPDGRPAPRRWTPRLRVDGTDRPGDAAVFWEATCLVRRSAFEQVGGWPGRFFFGHEGVDLAMRFLDHGWRIRYCPAIEVHHPATAASRHAVYYRTNARNRVWVARRNLPAPLIPVYLAVWSAATMARVRDPEALKTWFSGFADGWRTDAGPRRPISWRTVWTMTKLGRPPVW